MAGFISQSFLSKKAKKKRLKKDIFGHFNKKRQGLFVRISSNLGILPFLRPFSPARRAQKSPGALKAPGQNAIRISCRVQP